jgi:hypothetical protein
VEANRKIELPEIKLPEIELRLQLEVLGYWCRCAQSQVHMMRRYRSVDGRKEEFQERYRRTGAFDQVQETGF